MAGSPTDHGTGGRVRLAGGDVDSYWYSLCNMNTTIAVSGVGVVFPHTEKQRRMFETWLRGILKHSGVEKPPITLLDGTI